MNDNPFCSDTPGPPISCGDLPVLERWPEPYQFNGFASAWCEHIGNILDRYFQLVKEARQLPRKKKKAAIKHAWKLALEGK